MKIIKNGRRYDFLISIRNKEVTVATLEPWLIGINRYTLYYYGMEGEKSVDVWKKDVLVKEDEMWTEFLKRVEKIVLKKLYILGTSILEDIQHAENRTDLHI